MPLVGDLSKRRVNEDAVISNYYSQ